MSQTRFACLLSLLFVPISGFSAPLPTERALNFAAMPDKPLPIYVSAFVDRQSLGISDSRFRLPVITAAIGWWGRPGVGLELEVGKSVGDDSLNNFDLEVYSFSSLSIRFESPPIDRFSAYAAFGVSRINIDSGFSGEVVNSKKNTFVGGRGVFGLTYRVTPRLAVDAGFSHQEYDDDIGVNSFRVGVRYDFSHGDR